MNKTLCFLAFLAFLFSGCCDNRPKNDPIKGIIAKLSNQRSISDIHKCIDELTIALSNEKKISTMEAVSETLEIVGRINKLVYPLTEALRSKNYEQVETAVFLLGYFGPEAIYAKPDLIAILQDKNGRERLRARAVSTLGQICSKDTAIIPILISMLHDQQRSVRSRAAFAIGEIGADAESAIPTLTDTLKDKEENVRSQAIIALGKIGTKAKVAIPAILSTDGKHVQVPIIKALGLIGSQELPVVLKLLNTLKDQDPLIREAAAETIGVIGIQTPEIISALIELLKDRDEEVRKAASETLRKIK